MGVFCYAALADQYLDSDLHVRRHKGLGCGTLAVGLALPPPGKEGSVWAPVHTPTSVGLCLLGRGGKWETEDTMSISGDCMNPELSLGVPLLKQGICTMNDRFSLLCLTSVSPG